MLNAGHTNTRCRASRQHQQITAGDSKTKVLSQHGHLIGCDSDLDAGLKNRITAQSVQKRLHRIQQLDIQKSELFKLRSVKSDEIEDANPLV